MRHNETFNILRAGIFVVGIFVVVALCLAERDTKAEAPQTIQAETVAAAPEATPVQTIESTPEPSPSEIPHLDPYSLTEDERAVVEAVVAAEARGEGFKGMCLVAQCIRNTAEATGSRPDYVALEPDQYASPDYYNAEEASEAVAAVFDEGYQVTDEPIRYFYAPALCESPWHEQTLEHVLTHGGHRFFKEA